MDKEKVNVTNALPQELDDRLRELSEKHALVDLKNTIEPLNAADGARAIACLTSDMQVATFMALSKNAAAGIFTYLDSELRVSIVESIAKPEINERIRQAFQAVFDDLAADDAVDLLDELPANLVEALLSRATPDRRAQLNAILRYPPNSAGSLMTVEYIILGESMTAAEALAHVRKQGKKKETIYNCYAVGPGRKLTGAVSLRSIILSPEETLIHDIMSTPVIFARTLDDQEAVADKFKEYDLLAMPVVDREERIVGIITIDDIVDVIEAENTEDFEKMAALHPSEGGYLKTGVLRLARNRITWLLLMMISATFTGLIITHFEHLLASQVILASFIPMLMDTGGNCGSQVSTLVIRGMAVGELELNCWYKVLWKEIRVGMTVAAALCFVNWLRMLFFVKDVTPAIALVVNITLFITVTFAKVIGCLLPMCAKRFKLDPALMASPMITTIVDAFTLIVYFLVARHLLSSIS